MEETRQEDFLKAIQRATGDNSVSVIGIDDSFGFKCKQCGACCINRTDIIVNPFDVYNGAKYLGITPEDFVMQYTNIHLGPNSKIPVVTLKTSDNGFCPLLKFDIKDGGKFKCTIHPAKPGACANHPIGVAYSTDLTNGSTTTNYIKVEQCPNSVSNEMHTVREWVQPYLDHQDEINIAHKIQHMVVDYFNPRYFWMMIEILKKAAADDTENSIAMMLDIVSKEYVTCLVGVGYCEYDINKPFVEQAEENIKKLDDFCSRTKTLYDNMKVTFEKVIGKSISDVAEELERAQEGE